ncbi:MAG: alpha/beta hydrolase [Rhizobiaceae bacterium]|nr:alpha/beta hydrolase [Rhizobiaceae bacterium]
MWPFSRQRQTVQMRPHEPALLYAFDGNPAPEGMVAKSLWTPDRKRIRYATARTPLLPCRGTVVIFTGRNECIEKYHETSRDLLAAGLDVAVFDWRGQGDSERLIGNREKGYVRRFADYVTDADAMFHQVVLPDCRAPFFVLAHSLGSLVAMAAAPKLKSRVERMVLIAPFLGIQRNGFAQPFSTFWAGALARLMTLCGLGRLYFGGGAWRAPSFAANRVTRSPERFARNIGLYTAHPHLRMGGPTARWVAECVRTMRALNRRADSKDFRIPALVLIAGGDVIVPRDATQETVRLLPAAHAIIIDKAAHELLHEREHIRSATMKAILAFIPGSGPAGARTAPVLATQDLEQAAPVEA